MYVTMLSQDWPSGEPAVWSVNAGPILHTYMQNESTLSTDSVRPSLLARGEGYGGAEKISELQRVKAIAQSDPGVSKCGGPPTR